MIKLLKILPSTFFILGLSLLILAITSILTQHQGFALRLIKIVFYLFMLGILSYILEIKIYGSKSK